MTAEALAALRRYTWPGNVRELENVVSRVTLRGSILVARDQPVVLEESSFILALSDAPSRPPVAPLHGPSEPILGGRSLREAVEDFQRAAITRAVAGCGGNWSAAARLLGLHRSNLHHLAARLGLR